MTATSWCALVAMFLVPPIQEVPNPWKGKVPNAVAAAEKAGTVDAYIDALDVAYRADDWQAALKLSSQARDKHPAESRLAGRIARALWRAGCIVEAEQASARIPPETTDPVDLGTLIVVELARGKTTRAVELADRLTVLPSLTATDLSYVIAARLATDGLAGIPELLRKALRLSDPSHGYPEIYLADELQGLAEFFDSVGPQPLNQVVRYGSAPMPVTPLINLPGCSVMINGRGPYRMIVDTGGSITLSVDHAVAEEVGLKSIATASIRGVAGKDTSGQALIDEVRLGDIVCQRVMARIFGVRQAAAGIDGIIGTGIFAKGRMTLDFEHAELVVAPSAGDRRAAGEGELGTGTEGSGDQRRARGEPTAPRGRAVDIRIVGDAKLIALVTIEGQAATGLLDSGADVLALAPSRLKELFPGRPVRSIAVPALGVGADTAPRISMAPGVKLVFAGRTYENVGGLGLDVLDTVLGPLLGIQTDILIGMATFRDMRSCTVDYPACRLWVDWLENE